jgi:hypothetical protein
MINFKNYNGLTSNLQIHCTYDVTYVHIPTPTGVFFTRAYVTTPPSPSNHTLITPIIKNTLFIKRSMHHIKGFGNNLDIFKAKPYSPRISGYPSKVSVRSYQIAARTGKGLKQKCLQEDPTGLHPVGIEQLCPNKHCNDTICTKNTPGCLKWTEENAIFNLTHSPQVNAQPTIPLSPTDYNGNPITQYAKKFGQKQGIRVGEENTHTAADKLCNNSAVRKKIDDKIKDK